MGSLMKSPPLSQCLALQVNFTDTSPLLAWMAAVTQLTSLNQPVVALLATTQPQRDAL